MVRRPERLCDERVDLRTVAIGEEDRAGVGAQRADEPGAVVLFVLPRLLVLFDDVVFVILDVADRREPGLDVFAHALLVEVNRRLRLADKRAVCLESAGNSSRALS